MQNSASPPELTSDERTWGMFSHFGFIIGGFLTPLIIWQIKKSESSFIVANAKSALNWNLSLIAYIFALVILLVITVLVGGYGLMAVGIIFFYVILIGLVITNIAVSVIAGLKANKGQVGTYPFGIRFIK